MSRSTSQSSAPNLFGLVGAGGFGRTTMPWAIDHLTSRFGPNGFDVCFIESNPTRSSVNDIACLSLEQFLDSSVDHRFFNVAIADSRLREDLSITLLERGNRPMEIRATSASVGMHNTIGEGAVFGHLSTVTTNISIGRFFHCHMYSYVEHDCVIGDFVTFAPRVSCNGNVRIGDHVYIGTGAVIRQGTADSPLVIGEGAVIGMGAVVTKDVPPHTTVVGNPARPMAAPR